jgi:hypothetical protein
VIACTISETVPLERVVSLAQLTSVSRRTAVQQAGRDDDIRAARITQQPRDRRQMLDEQRAIALAPLPDMTARGARERRQRPARSLISCRASAWATCSHRDPRRWAVDIRNSVGAADRENMSRLRPTFTASPRKAQPRSRGGHLATPASPW